MWSVPKQVSPLLQRQQAKTSGICSCFLPHIFLSISFTHSIMLFPIFLCSSSLFPPLLALTQTVLHLLFALIVYSFDDSSWSASVFLTLQRVSLWVFSRSQWETAAYQACRKSGQQQPHLPPLSPLWVHAPEMSEHTALSMSLCSLSVVYTRLSDGYVLGSKGSWSRSHSLVCHLVLFDQKEAVKHQVKTHLLPLLTHTACLLLPWPLSTYINTLKHWATGSAAAFTPNHSQLEETQDVGYVTLKCFHMQTDSDHLININYTETTTDMSWRLTAWITEYEVCLSP